MTAVGGQRSGRAAAALLAGLALLVVAVVLLQDPLGQLWGWLGWWHWVVLPLLAALAVLGAVALLRVAPHEEAPAPDPRRAALDDAVAEEQERLEALPLHQLVLEVSRTLRRDGWADARVEGGVLVVAHRGAQSLVVRVKDLPSGRVTREEVEALVARAGLSASGVAVFATSGGYGRAALVAAQELGAVPMDGEDLARWVALGPSAWPTLRPLAHRPAADPR